MKRISRTHAVIIGLVLLAAMAATGVGINAGETPKKIRVIYTDDTMGYLDPCG